MMDRRQFLKMIGVALVLSHEVIDAAAQAPPRPALLTFDGGYELGKWRDSLAFGQELSAEGRRAKFTYFVIGAHMERLHGATVGDAGSPAMVTERIAHMQQAIDAGHELACHTMLHRNGAGWSEQRWTDELAAFDAIAARHLRKDGKPYKAVTFRAPYLSHNDAMYRALERCGYRNDCSMIGSGTGRKEGIFLLRLPFYARDSGRRVLGMDYNWHVGQVPSAELEHMLARELASASENYPLSVAMHFEDYTHGKTYWATAKGFLRAQARESRFMTVDDYLSHRRI